MKILSVVLDLLYLHHGLWRYDGGSWVTTLSQRINFPPRDNSRKRQVLIPTVGNQKIQVSSSLQWHNVHCKYNENPSNGSRVINLAEQTVRTITDAWQHYLFSWRKRYAYRRMDRTNLWDAILNLKCKGRLNVESNNVVSPRKILMLKT